MLSKMYKLLKNDTVIARFIFCLFVIQPILDIISYFAVKHDFTSITTMVRMFMFAVIFVWAYLISEHKKIYYVMVGIIALFWGGHVVVNIGNGYLSVFQDTSMYIKTIQGPMLTLAFITFLMKSKNVAAQIGKAFLVNYIIISVSIIISYLIDLPVYTYELTKIGIKGWFYTGNAQSCIIAVMALLAITYAYRQKKKLLFLLAVLLIFSNLFVFGTRVAYYSIFIVAIAFLILLLWNKSKEVFAYAVIVVCTIICLVAYEKSPTYVQQNKVSVSFQDNDELINNVVENVGSMTESEEVESTENTENTENTESTEGTENTESTEGTENTESTEGTENIGNTESEDVDEGGIIENEFLKYESVYKKFCSKLVERFGLEAVVKKFDYSLSANDMMNNRKLKVAYCSLVMDEQNMWTKMFGYEYLNMISEAGDIYDPENDFPALYYLYGYVGLFLYVAFIAYFAIVGLKSVLLNIKHISMEKGALCISLILMLGCAELSGNVIRRPNVSIYLSVMLAYLFVLCISEKKKDKK